MPDGARRRYFASALAVLIAFAAFGVFSALAGTFLAGTASCRIEVSDVDALFAELQSAGVLHDVSRAGVTTTEFGTREFATLDSDGNLLTFFRWNDG